MSNLDLKLVNFKNMFNSGMNDLDRLKNEFNLKEVNGKKLLRKLKLDKLQNGSI